jgi:hypothetical protein
LWQLATGRHELLIGGFSQKGGKTLNGKENKKAYLRVKSQFEVIKDPKK